MKKSEIADLVTLHIPRQLVMGIVEAMYVASQRAYDACLTKHVGHRATALGMERYFQLNETLHEVFEANGCEPQKLLGNKIVEGRSGIFKIARENYNDTKWKRLFKSKRKQELIGDNTYIEKLVQPDFFADDNDVPKATIFFVCRYSGSLQNQPGIPLSIELVIPSADGKRWLFHEPAEIFLNRYNVMTPQPDKAVAKLKPSIIKKGSSRESGQ